MIAIIGGKSEKQDEAKPVLKIKPMSSRIGGNSDEEAPENEESDEAQAFDKQSASAHEILNAIETKNVEKLVAAMKAFHYACDDEKESEESESPDEGGE